MGITSRHTYLINRVFQIRFILEIVAVVFGATLLASLAFYFLGDWKFSSTFFSAHRDAQNVRSLLVPAVALAALVTFAVVSILSVFIIVRETHRLAGPLFRFEKNIREMAQGRLETITALRKGDELRGLADALNGLSGSLLAASSRTREAISRLRAVKEEMVRTGALSPEAASTLEAEIAEIEASSRFFST